MCHLLARVALLAPGTLCWIGLTHRSLRCGCVLIAPAREACENAFFSNKLSFVIMKKRMLKVANQPCVTWLLNSHVLANFSLKYASDQRPQYLKRFFFLSTEQADINGLENINAYSTVKMCMFIFRIQHVHFNSGVSICVLETIYQQPLYQTVPNYIAFCILYYTLFIHICLYWGFVVCPVPYHITC